MTSTLSERDQRPASNVNSITTDVREGVLIATIDQPDDNVNTVNRDLGAELERILEQIDRDRGIRAAVVTSGKPDIFIAGADIEQFLEFRSEDDAEEASRYAHRLFNLVDKSPTPVVAAIHGACLGAGLEFALACRYRICTDHPKTVLALPEVQLGIIPGAGGTQRLPRLVGVRNALEMILTGKNVRAKKALQIGLVDEMVHPAILIDVAIQRAHDLADRSLEPKRGAAKGIAGVAFDANPLGRALVFKKARDGVIEKTAGHYPAPLAAIDVVRTGLQQGFERGLEEEAKVFGTMALTQVSRELVFLFFATQSLKKDPGVEQPPPPPTPTDIHKIAVLGAGFMGAGITSVAVQQGTLVRLKDTDVAHVGKALAAVREVVKERLERRQITRQQFEDMMALAGGTVEYTGFGNVELVIEAVFEDVDVKHSVLQSVEKLIPSHAVIASNTSTIPIARIAEGLEWKDRVLGMHFFSPVHKMPLLEVIVTPATSRQAAVTAVAYGRKLGKTVIIVNDGPGFYTTRTLSAYLNEAGRMLDEGVAIDILDKALVDFGFPVGPITLMDEVGLDVGGKVGVVMAEAFGARMVPGEGVRRVVESGRTGRKGRKGFYLYDADGKKGGVDQSVYELIHAGDRRASPQTMGPIVGVEPDEIVNRCVLAMVNEAVRCLEEGILRSPRDGDVGAVFGIGFPPFRGGPFRYVDAIGATEIVRQLEALNQRFAPRFAPARRLLEMAVTRKRFYPATGRPV